jgi:hypothetical protein
MFRNRFLALILALAGIALGWCDHRLPVRIAELS